MSKQAIHTLATLGWISKKLDEHAKSIGLWDMRGLALQTVVMSGEATDTQKSEWNDMVTERRAIAIITGLMKQAEHDMKSTTSLEQNGAKDE